MNARMQNWRVGYEAALWALMYVAGYVLLDGLSYVQPILQLGITPWSPQAGLTLTFLVLRGHRWAWLTVIAALLAEVSVRGAPAPWTALWLGSLTIAAGYGIAAYLLRAVRLRESIEAPRGVLWLLF